MSEKRPSWFFPFLTRLLELRQDHEIDRDDVGFLVELTQMNNGGRPITYWSHRSMAYRFDCSVRTIERRMARYEELGVVESIRKPLSPGRAGGEGQTKGYRFLAESPDTADGSMGGDDSESPDMSDGPLSNADGIHPTNHPTNHPTPGVAPTRTLESQNAPLGSSTFQEPSPTGLVPAHRQAMGDLNLDAARSHFTALMNIIGEEEAPASWQLGHGSATAKVPEGWTCADLLSLTVEALAASERVTSMTGILRKVRRSGGGDPQVTLLALGGVLKEYGGSGVHVPRCNVCDYPPSLCECPEAVGASSSFPNDVTPSHVTDRDGDARWGVAAS